ncbi:methyltransferase domain-containing protein [Microvirga ossetica]|uniref:methyltransferase domain-containing protein n=1 Tax=Microvirga ossetica TaxID=1882682 RepID=UPI000C1488A9
MFRQLPIFNEWNLSKEKVENLPFRDDEFDIVVFTHVIEHILDYKTAISELRRIAARKLSTTVARCTGALITS